MNVDPQLDLVLERSVPVPPEKVFQAWTKPHHLKHWFAPKPWTVAECEVELQPGGIFRTVMAGPNGERYDMPGCVLEVVENRRFVFTDALGPGFRPTTEPFFTAIILFEPKDGGTLYTAIARHGTPAGRAKHEQMGFAEGWSTSLDQLVDHMSMR